MAHIEITQPLQPLPRQPDAPLSPQASAIIMHRALEQQASQLRADGLDVTPALTVVGNFLQHAILRSMPSSCMLDPSRTHRLASYLIGTPDGTAPFGNTVDEIDLLPPQEYLRPLPEHLPSEASEVARRALQYAAVDVALGGSQRLEALDVLMHSNSLRP